MCLLRPITRADNNDTSNNDTSNNDAEVCLGVLCRGFNPDRMFCF